MDRKKLPYRSEKPIWDLELSFSDIDFPAYADIATHMTHNVDCYHSIIQLLCVWALRIRASSCKPQKMQLGHQIYELPCVTIQLESGASGTWSFSLSNDKLALNRQLSNIFVLQYLVSSTTTKKLLPHSKVRPPFKKLNKQESTLNCRNQKLMLPFGQALSKGWNNAGYVADQQLIYIGTFWDSGVVDKPERCQLLSAAALDATAISFLTIATLSWCAGADKYFL